MKLYEIASEYDQLLSNAYDLETGEVNEQALIKLDEVGKELDKKCIAVASFIKNLDAERKAISEAKKEMADREERFNKIVESMTHYLQSNMERTGKTEVSCPYFAIKIKKCPISVDIYDEESIPSEYRKVKETITIDKMKIREDIKLGAIIPGVSLKQNLRLEIK